MVLRINPTINFRIHARFRRQKRFNHAGRFFETEDKTKSPEFFILATFPTAIMDREDCPLRHARKGSGS